MARWILTRVLTVLGRACLSLKNLRVGSAYWALYSQLQDFESRCILALGILSAIAAGVPLPLMAVVFRNIIESFPPPESQLNQAIHYLLAIASAYFALTWTWTVSWGIIGGRIARRLQESLVEKVVGLDMAFFDTETLDLTSILTADTQTIRRGTSEKVGLFIQSITYFVATFVTGFILSPPLTGVLLAAVFPAMLILVSIGSTLVSRNSRRAGRYAEKASAAAEQAIKAVRVVQAFGAIDALGDSHARTLHHAAHYALRKSVCSAALLASIYFICYSTNSLAFYWGTELGGSSGTIYAVVFLILDASFVFTQVGPFIQTLAMASGAGEKVLQLLQRPNPTIDPYNESGHKVREDDFDTEIVCHDLSFAYPVRKERMVLDQINLDIRSGSSIGVVGLSGSGKSSLAGLLLRLYDPTSGYISIGGRNLKSLNTKTFRSKVALVDQEPVLFSASILDNVKAGILDPNNLSDEDVQSRCRQAISDANADFVWDLVGGMNHHVGNSGGGLSGGQRQRICLARALVRQPRLLILDEPTSALDSTSERKILDSLKMVASSGCTILMIAHRLSTIKEMDTIVVMADGKIQERGSHVDLMCVPNGSYRLLVEAQQVAAEAVHDVDDGTASGTLQDGGRRAVKDLGMRRSPHLTAGQSPVQLPGRVPGRAPGSVSGSIMERATDLPARSRRPPSNSTSSQQDNAKQQPADENEDSSVQLLRRCIKLNSARENVILGIGLFASAVMGVLIVYEAIVFGHLVTLLQANTNRAAILGDVRFYCLMFFIISLIALFASGISNACFGTVSENLLTKIRERSLRTVLKQDQEFFSVPEHSAHRLSAAITSDANHIAGLSGSIIATIFSVCVNLVAGVTVAIAFAWSIALVLLTLLPAIVFAGYLRVTMLTRYEKRHHESFKQAAALASEAVQNIRTVAAYGHEGVILQHYKAAIEGPYRQDFWYCIFGDLALTLSYCIVFFTYSLAYWWGARQVRDGHFTELDFFTMLPAFLLTAQQAGQLFSAAPELLQARTAARRLFRLLDSRPTIIGASQDEQCAKEAEKSASMAMAHSFSSDSQQTLNGAVDGTSNQATHRQLKETLDVEKCNSPPPTLPSSSTEGAAATRHALNGSSVTLTGVSLTYPSNPAAAVLDDVTFDIPGGSTVGLVGPSGAGKSSLIALIERFYDPVSGGLAIDDVDIRQMPVEMHRARLSYVPQEPILFDGTVAFNIGLGLSESMNGMNGSHAEVERLCRHYGLHDFIVSLPEGYNTEVGAGGSRLSGGQKQRVAFARALVRRPKIIILDEATSALDAHSEQEVQGILDDVKAEGRTVIIIAHRMASVKDADKIIVLDEGHVVEMGGHEELMKLKGVYSQMVNAQAVA